VPNPNARRTVPLGENRQQILHEAQRLRVSFTNAPRLRRAASVKAARCFHGGTKQKTPPLDK